MGGGQVHIIPNMLHYGQSPLNYRTGLANRRILGVEWVLPDGEILKMGSLSVNDDPFWGEGIGPDLRGILRGWVGWAGSLGTVTKMAVKLFPFQTEPLIPTGISPDTALLVPEARVRYYNFQFPTREALIKAFREIGKAEIAAGAMRVPHMWRYIGRSKTKEDFWKYWGEPGEKEEEVKNVHILRVLLVGYSSEEQLQYEERVLMDIVNELGGKGRAARPTDESVLISADAYGMWSMTGGFTSVTSTIDTMGSALAGGESFAKIKKEYTPPFMDDYGEVGWFQLGELGHMGYLEFPIYWDPFDKEGLKEVDKLIYVRAPKEDIKDGRYSFFHLMASPLKLVGPPYGPNYHKWMLEIKKAFDPNNVSNPPAPEHGDRFVEEAGWLKPIKDW